MTSVDGMTLWIKGMDLKSGTSTGKAVKQGSDILCKVLGSEDGYLEGVLYNGKFPQIVRWDGLPGNSPNGSPDPKDGLLIMPTYHPMQTKPPILLDVGEYELEIRAYKKINSMVPATWNIFFNIIQ